MSEGVTVKELCNAYLTASGDGGRRPAKGHRWAMNDEAALLNAIVAQPGEDTPRLALADWYQEHDEADRAEYIRLGLRLHELLNPEAESSREERADLDEVRQKMRRLLKQNFSSWGLEIPGRWAPQRFEGEDEVHLSSPGNRKRCRVRLTRGFVSHVEVERDVFLRKGFAEGLFVAHPVESVKLSDRKPVRLRRLWTWYKQRSLGGRTADHHVGEQLWSRLTDWSPVPGYELLRGYPSKALALVALSRSCVELGRQNARLPPPG